MCEAMTALAIGSALLTYQTQSDNADAQTRAATQRKQLQDADLARQQQAQTEAAAGQMNTQARNAMKDAALFDTISGEFGGGVTNTRAGAAQGIQQGEAMATLGKNANGAAIQNSFTGLDIQSQTNSTLASISQPSLLGTALTIGSSYLDGQTRAAAKAAAAKLTTKTGGIN